MTYSTIRIETDPRGIARLTLARSHKHNALNAEMMSELTRAAAELGASAQVRAVILAADGESFCAGGDLEWMKTQFAASRDQRMAEARVLAGMLRALNEMPKPLIAAVQGPAYGGGIGLISVCDNAIAADTAKFGLTETRLGLIPATIGPYVVARMGEGPARRVFMSARIFGAADAKGLGLLGSVVAPNELQSAVEAEAKAYLSVAPGAVASAKALVRRLGAPIDDGVIEATISRLADTWEGAEAHEGISAFFEKRRPKWTV